MKSNDFPESTPKAPLDSDAVSTNSIPQNGDLSTGISENSKKSLKKSSAREALRDYAKEREKAVMAKKYLYHRILSNSY